MSERTRDPRFPTRCENCKDRLGANAVLDADGLLFCSVGCQLTGRYDWTENDEGRANASELFVTLSSAVEQVIRGSAHDLIAGRADQVARLIMAQLAHRHGLMPPESDRKRVPVTEPPENDR